MLPQLESYDPENELMVYKDSSKNNDNNYSSMN